MSDAAADADPRCAFCGAALEIVHVHGHGQCARCGTNVDPCCSGASAADEAGATGGNGCQLAPDLLPRLFDHLGGRTATVTEASLAFALAQSLDTSLDEARMVLRTAQELGAVVLADGTARLP